MSFEYGEKANTFYDTQYLSISRQKLQMSIVYLQLTVTLLTIPGLSLIN